MSIAIEVDSLSKKYRLGEYQAATDLLARNCRDVYTWFDTQHEYAVAATISLANCLVATNDLVSASRKVREALEICTEIFGPEHVLTMAATVSTASVSRAMGEYRSARRSDERAAATLAATLGPNHPSTLAASHNLAVDLALLGETRPALERGSDVLQRGQGSQDPTHPDSLVTAINVALLKARIRDSVVASAQFEAHLASYRSLVRPDHPRITAAQSGTLLELDIEVPPS